jgi:hypothetical protein
MLSMHVSTEPDPRIAALIEQSGIPLHGPPEDPWNIDRIQNYLAQHRDDPEKEGA